MPDMSKISDVVNDLSPDVMPDVQSKLEEISHSGGNVFSVTEVNSPTSFRDLTEGIEDKVTELFVLNNHKRTNKTYIAYGAKNNHPNKLIDLAHGSPTHKSILIFKTSLTYGKGINIQCSTDDEKEALEDFFKETNITDSIYKMCWDMVLFGAFTMQHIYEFNVDLERDGTRELKRVYKQPFQQFRLANPIKLEATGEWKPVEGVLHPTWGKSYRKKSEDRLPLWHKESDYEVFGDDLPSISNGNVLYYDRIYTPLMNYYPLPDYQTKGGLNSILLDSELIEFDVNELLNNLSSGYIVTFIRKNYSASDPEKERKIRAKEKALVSDDMKGARNNKRVVIMRAEPPEKGQDIDKPFLIDPVPSNNNSERHKILDDRKSKGILTAHGVPAEEIVGVPRMSGSGFSSEAEKLRVGTDIMMFTRIKDFREPIIKYLKNMADEAGLQYESISFQDNIPFRKNISNTMWRYAFTENEYREAHEYSKLEESELINIRENRTLKTGSNESGSGNN